ncbi:aldolase/citrate lyase family protein [Phyllobacterium sp. SB3]|uniref:HpcH/HpaI aldolase family protein n=1 Tax=Phyllobacterium sp. SB3 TaxID=3156073 RepID=UPI0032AECB13
MAETHSRGLLSLNSGSQHLTTFVQIPDLNVIEILVRTALDSFILDCQHGMFSGSTIGPAIAAAAYSDKPALIRIPVGDFAFASRALDLGAAAIICPMINSAADARQLVTFVKYPPVGLRSWGPRRALPLSGLSGDLYLQRSNELTQCFVMIETAEALSNLDEILRVEGVDGVFVGPTDLSVSLTNGRSLAVTSDMVLTAVETVAASCRQHGKHAGIFALDAQQAVGHFQRGFNFVALAQDAMFMSQAADSGCARVRELSNGSVR